MCFQEWDPVLEVQLTHLVGHECPLCEMCRSGTLQTFDDEQQINIKEMDDRTALYHSGSNYFAERGCSLEKQEAKWYEEETLHNRRYFKWNEKCPFQERNIWSSGRICRHQMETLLTHWKIIWQCSGGWNPKACVKPSPFFSPFSVVRPTQSFGIKRKKK